MRIRTGHYPGQWLDLGPGSAPMSARIGGTPIVSRDAPKTICGMPLKTGGGCAAYTGHMGTHASRVAMDAANAKRRASRRAA